VVSWRSLNSSEEATVTDEYNYDEFRGEEDFEAYMGRPHAGERAPDGALTDLAGEQVSLAELWHQSHLMLEFGSYT
jgi:hypothetical protein